MDNEELQETEEKVSEIPVKEEGNRVRSKIVIEASCIPFQMRGVLL